jgi:hypothetical protein
MSRFGLSAAALLATVVLVSASPMRAEDAASDHCTSDAGFAPCPKLLVPAGTVFFGASAPLAGASRQSVGVDWCTADGGLARCNKLDQWIAMSDWQGPAKYASLIVPTE